MLLSWIGEITHAPVHVLNDSGSVLVDTSSIYEPIVLATDWEVFTALGSAFTVISIPTVNAHLSRPVADVVRATTIFVFFTLVLEALVVIGKQQPWLLSVDESNIHVHVDYKKYLCLFYGVLSVT